MDHNSELSAFLNIEDWVFKPVYLTNMFRKMNEINISLQRKTIENFDANAKVPCFKRKFMYLLYCKVKGDIDSFPLTKNC